MKCLKTSVSIVVSLLIGFSGSLYSQNDKEDDILKLLKEGDKIYSKENYIKAAQIYERVDSALEDDPFIDKRLGITYYKLGKYDKAVPLLQKLHRQSDTIDIYVNYYLGFSLQKLGKYDKAVKMYQSCLDYVEHQPAVSGREAIKERIEQCRFRGEIERSRMDVNITRLDSAVNTEYPDYGVKIHPQDSILFFTSRRETATGLLRKIFKADEDVYISKYNNGIWEKAKRADLTFKNEANTAVIGIAPCNNILYVYTDANNGDIMKCKIREDGTLAQPDSLKGDINTFESTESAITITPEGETCYFVSDRTDIKNYGGTDIFKATRNGKDAWGNIENCGPEVNSKYNENFVFWSQDDTALYFSSNRKRSVGGFDIFKAEATPEGSLEQANNIGLPVNTSKNDISFYKLGSKAWYARGYKDKKEDIFEIDFDTRRYNPQWHTLAIEGVRKIDHYRTLRPVYYNIGRSRVNPDDSAVKKLVRVLRDVRNASISIAGHSDWSGNRVNNTRLSLERAANLADFLFKNGINPELLQVEAYGEDKLLTDTLFTTDSLREKALAVNRRVDIKVKKQGEPYLYVQNTRLKGQLGKANLSGSNPKFAVMIYIAPKPQNAYTFPDFIKEDVSREDKLYYWHTPYYNSIHQAAKKLKQLGKKYENAYLYVKHF
jgi:outer membrane protein OmpA-like peptidoglycan-associated protein